MLIPSTPGAPRLARTSRHALRITSLRATLSHRGMETTIPILLSAAVQHALESTNPVHTQGAADGPSRNVGTHQSPSRPSRASMKRGPFPMWPAFPTSEYYDPLRLPLDHPATSRGLRLQAGLRFPAPAAPGSRRLCRVPTTTFRTFNAHYAGGFRSARSWNKDAFHGLRRHETGSAPSTPVPQDGFCLTTLTQASLTLQTARSLRPASHPTSRSRTGASLPGTQASPRTGLAPAGRRELVAPTSCGPPLPSWRRSSPDAPRGSRSEEILRPRCCRCSGQLANSAGCRDSRVDP
jgi:hypothetical protein